jgi:hypothetical protein
MSKYNYIECPDVNCSVWMEDGNIEKLCKEKCKGVPKLYLLCHSVAGCGKKIYVELCSSIWRRVECDCGCCYFTRMSGKYQRIINE